MTFLRLCKRHKKTTILVILLILLVSWGAWSMRPKPPVYEYATVLAHDVVQQVSVTGRVKPDIDVSLAFEASGRVEKVFVKVGDTVKAGQTLVSLDKADLLANLEQAQARVDTESARLAQLRAGTRPEEVAITEVQLASAKASYLSAQNAAFSAIEDAYTKVDDSIRNKSDKFFTNPRSDNPKITFYLNDMNTQNLLEYGRGDMESLLSSWKAENDTLEPLGIDDAAILRAKDHLLKARTFLDNEAFALSAAVSGNGITQTMIDGYKTDISTARTSVNTALSGFDTVSSALSSAKNNVDLQASNLALAKAPTLPETINAQIATVEQMQANVRAIYADLAKMVLRSPIDGMVTEQDAKAGETVAPGVSVASVISKDQLQIEAYIPEADIAKVKIGDIASTTLDAYGDSIDFPTVVLSVDPSETVIEGVATYKTVFRFMDSDVRIKPGMTANIDILTERKNNVPALPQRVIIRKDGSAFVQVLGDMAGNTTKEIPIRAGLRGSDGYTEIVSGLSLGDKVIVPKN